MPSVQYGNRTIDYNFLQKDSLKSHYITVQKGDGVILKGKAISKEDEQALILKKAKWILDKLDLVESISENDIVTGSRIQYLGRRYYIELFLNNDLSEIVIDFTESKFKIQLPKTLNNQASLKEAFDKFFKQKAIEKITPRIRKWSKSSGLKFNEIKYSIKLISTNDFKYSNSLFKKIDISKLRDESGVKLVLTKSVFVVDKQLSFFS